MMALFPLASARNLMSLSRGDLAGIDSANGD